MLGVTFFIFFALLVLFIVFFVRRNKEGRDGERPSSDMGRHSPNTSAPDTRFQNASNSGSNPTDTTP